MKLWAALRDAWLGWVDIVRLRPGWQDRFGFSFGALAKALVIFFLFAFLAIAMGSVQGGMPSLPGLLANLLVQSLGLVALLIGIVVTKLAVKSEVPLRRVLVPGIYGMVFYLVAGSVLAAISIETVPIVLLGLVFLLYSLGRAATQAVILGGMLFVIQFAVSYLVLRQMGRLDGFVPFLVADNWATFFTSILSLGLLLSGLPADVVIIAIGIVVIIVEINIARLIVTLPPLQIAMFIVAQLVGSGIGLLLLGGMVAMPGV